RTTGMVALEAEVVRLVPPAARRLERIEHAGITGRAVGGVDLAVLELGLPVQRDHRAGPAAIAVDPEKGSVHVRGVLAPHDVGAGAVGAVPQSDRAAIAALAEEAAEGTPATPSGTTRLARVEIERRVARLVVADARDVARHRPSERAAQVADGYPAHVVADPAAAKLVGWA